VIVIHHPVEFFCSKPSWGKARDAHITDYKNVLRTKLSTIQLQCFHAISAAILNMHSYWSNILITLFSHAWMLGNPLSPIPRIKLRTDQYQAG